MERRPIPFVSLSLVIVSNKNIAWRVYQKFLSSRNRAVVRWSEIEVDDDLFTT